MNERQSNHFLIPVEAHGIYITSGTYCDGCNVISPLRACHCCWWSWTDPHVFPRLGIPLPLLGLWSHEAVSMDGVIFTGIESSGSGCKWAYLHIWLIDGWNCNMQRLFLVVVGTHNSLHSLGEYDSFQFSSYIRCRPTTQHEGLITVGNFDPSPFQPSIQRHSHRASCCGASSHMDQPMMMMIMM